jgi:hypothetical protein
MARSGQAHTSPVRTPRAAAAAREERLSLRQCADYFHGGLVADSGTEASRLNCFACVTATWIVGAVILPRDRRRL